MDRQYNINFTSNSAATLQALQALAAALQGLNTAAQQAQKGVAAVGAQAQQAAGGASGLATAMGSIVSVGAGLSAVHQVVGALNSAMDEARGYAKEVATEIMGTRDSLREIVAMRGGGKEGATTDKVIEEFLGVRAGTGLTEEEARAFTTQLESGIFTAEDRGNLGPEGPARQKLEAEIKKQTALYALSHKIDPGTAGIIASSILAAGPVGSAEEYAARLSRVVDVGYVKGQGELTEFAKSGARTIATLGREIGTPEEVAVLHGVASAAKGSSPMRAGTMLEQAVRGMNDFGDEKRAGFLGSIGVKPGMKFLDELRRIAPKLEAADAGGDTAEHFLQSNGFGSVEEVRAIAFLARNLKVIEKRTAEVAPGTKADAAAQNEDWLKTQEAENRLSDVSGAIGRTTRGLKEEELASARKAAEGRLAATDRIDTASTNFNEWMVKIATLGMGSDWRQVKIDREAKEELYRQARAVGIDPTASWNAAGGKPGATKLTPETRDIVFRERFNALAAEVKEKGGSPTGDPAELLKATREVRDAIYALHAAGPRPAAPPPTRATPRPGTVAPVAPARPGA